ncbi:calmodulin-binding transcription activator 4 [Magnolia sinica]|uniref:calmodulin-binding transcription activator 4 n=1 Tax=Magnolia sinica TaxID=86752 RepID=UPI00265B266C|nr:calmodulin-binding transcription activator 4 [Magnolia sinica]
MQSSKGFEINKLFQEAQTRWLKPAEVLFILQNYEKHQLAVETPQNPPSGSLFLFNKRVNRYFRKDGHNWRKKKDGRTVGEAHERLKVGNADALNCYYAHGEQNPNFQRRSYWMLDPACDHIVLVHYREINEGRRNAGSSSNLLTDSNSNFSPSAGFYNSQNQGSSGISELYEPYQSSFSPGSVEEVSSKLVVRNNEMNHLDAVDRSGAFGTESGPEVKQALRRITEQLSLGDDDVDSVCLEKQALKRLTAQLSLGDDDADSMYLEKLPSHYSQDEESHDQLSDANAGKQDGSNHVLLLRNSGDARKQYGQSLHPRYTSPSWKDMLELSSSSTRTDFQENSDTLTQGIPESSTSRMLNFEAGSHAKDTRLHENDRSLYSTEKVMNSVSAAQQPENMWLNYRGSSAENGANWHLISESDFSVQLSAAREFLLGSDTGIISPTSSGLLQEVGKSTLSTNSSGTSAVEVESGVGILKKTNRLDWMETRNVSIDKHKHTPDYYEGWLDKESNLGTSLGIDSSLTVAQVQQFSIREISPEWAYSDEVTKVIITGDFLCDPSESAWACMFGDVEVPVEIIQAGVLRCLVPQHAAGKVTLCITAGNRESCSEIREFEYHSKPKMPTSSSDVDENDATNKSTEEVLLLVSFAEILLPVQNEDSVRLETEQLRKLKIADDTWGLIKEALSVGSETPTGILDWVLQELLKDKLQQWLLSKCHGGEVAGCSLSKQEQGIIHMIAGLGYEWALNSVLNCGVGINFRDANGWTALHWAARFGREKMVAALLAAGASPGVVTDPTAQDPAGKSPASIAAASGHKGLAGYLSEVGLTSHLSSLKLEENEISKGSAALEAERTVESIADRSVQMPSGAIEDQLSLQDSLAAVRNAAQAAARIQSAFRAHSFRRRQQSAAATYDEYGMTPDDIQGLLAASKFRSLRDHKLNTAALSIQKKYRGWKGRKDFLTLRQNVVKIQAHVRGHQVRKKYNEFLWTVGVLEKVVLRWRRKGVGLRGFRAESESIDEGEDDDILKVFRKQKVDVAIDEAVSRVLSVVDSPKARQQYRRMLESYRKAKAEQSSSGETASYSRDCYNMENDDDQDMYHFA